MLKEAHIKKLAHRIATNFKYQMPSVPGDISHAIQCRGQEMTRLSEDLDTSLLACQDNLKQLLDERRQELRQVPDMFSMPLSKRRSEFRAHKAFYHPSNVTIPTLRRSYNALAATTREDWLHRAEPVSSPKQIGDTRPDGTYYRRPETADDRFKRAVRQLVLQAQTIVEVASLGTTISPEQTMSLEYLPALETPTTKELYNRLFAQISVLNHKLDLIPLMAKEAKTLVSPRVQGLVQRGARMYSPYSYIARTEIPAIEMSGRPREPNEGMVIKTFGPFRVTLNFGNLVRGARDMEPGVLTLPTPDAKQFVHHGASTYWHPHLSNEGRLCMGDGASPHQTMWQAGMYGNALFDLENGLQRYSPDAPHRPIEQFSSGSPPVTEELGTCAHCGTEEADVLVCQSCGDAFCAEGCGFLSGCDSCGFTFCIDCMSSDDESDDYYCESCFTRER